MESEERGSIRYVEQIDENVDMSKPNATIDKQTKKTDLKQPEDWTKYRYVSKDSVWYRSVDHIDRIHCKDMSCDDFVNNFEKSERPVMIQGLTESWPASQKWNWKTLCRDYGNVRFQCGDDDNGTRFNNRNSTTKVVI